MIFGLGRHRPAGLLKSGPTPASRNPSQRRRRAARAGRQFDRSIVEGPIWRAVWKIAWPTVLQNAIGGLQGIIDHAMVGHFVGFAANAAIGVSWQIFLVVIVFISSLFTGMGVLVARAAGANDHQRVDRVVYQAFLVAVLLSVGVLAPSGYFLAPQLLTPRQRQPRSDRAGAAVPADDVPVQHRHAAVLHAGRRAARGRRCANAAASRRGDDRAEHRASTCMLISGAGPIPALGTRGAAIGTVLASVQRVGGGDVDDADRTPGDPLPPRHVLEAGFRDHQAAVPVRAARRDPGRGDERGRRPAAAVHRVARAQRGSAGGLRRGLRGAVLAGHLDLGRSDGGGGRGRRAEPGRGQSRSVDPGRAPGRPDRPGRRGLPGGAVPVDPAPAARASSRSPIRSWSSWGRSCCGI